MAQVVVGGIGGCRSDFFRGRAPAALEKVQPHC